MVVTRGMMPAVCHSAERHSTARRRVQKHGIYKNLGQNNCNEGQSLVSRILGKQLEKEVGP